MTAKASKIAKKVSTTERSCTQRRYVRSNMSLSMLDLQARILRRILCHLGPNVAKGRGRIRLPRSTRISGRNSGMRRQRLLEVLEILNMGHARQQHSHGSGMGIMGLANGMGYVFSYDGTMIELNT